jgi:heme ABC exporter ATP-binding subunit CcmA
VPPQKKKTAPVGGLAVRGLGKKFADRTVLEKVSFDVGAGEVVAVVGPNGAGKTTLLRCVVGADVPDAGEVTLAGRPLDERDADTRRAVGAVLDDLDFFADLTVTEHLDLFARAHGTPDADARVDAAMADLSLDQVRDQLPSTLSSGQRRRLALATTLVRPLELLVLDEPEQRLDVAGRRWLAGSLRAHAAAGVAVLLASHDDELLDAVRARRVDVHEP